MNLKLLVGCLGFTQLQAATLPAVTVSNAQASAIVGGNNYKLLLQDAGITEINLLSQLSLACQNGFHQLRVPAAGQTEVTVLQSQYNAYNNAYLKLGGAPTQAELVNVMVLAATFMGGLLSKINIPGIAAFAEAHFQDPIYQEPFVQSGPDLLAGETLDDYTVNLFVDVLSVLHSRYVKAGSSVQPIIPVGPSKPVQPVNPVNPVQPIIPLQPSSPISPVTPTQTVTNLTTAQQLAVTNALNAIINDDASAGQQLGALPAAQALFTTDLAQGLNSLQQAGANLDTAFQAAINKLGGDFVSVIGEGGQGAGTLGTAVYNAQVLRDSLKKITNPGSDVNAAIASLNQAISVALDTTTGFPVCDFTGYGDYQTYLAIGGKNGNGIVGAALMALATAYWTAKISVDGVADSAAVNSAGTLQSAQGSLAIGLSNLLANYLNVVKSLDDLNYAITVLADSNLPILTNLQQVAQAASNLIKIATTTMPSIAQDWVSGFNLSVANYLNYYDSAGSSSDLVNQVLFDLDQAYNTNSVVIVTGGSSGVSMDNLVVQGMEVAAAAIGGTVATVVAAAVVYALIRRANLQRALEQQYAVYQEIQANSLNIKITPRSLANQLQQAVDQVSGAQPDLDGSLFTAALEDAKRLVTIDTISAFQQLIADEGYTLQNMSDVLDALQQASAIGNLSSEQAAQLTQAINKIKAAQDLKLQYATEFDEPFTVTSLDKFNLEMSISVSEPTLADYVEGVVNSGMTQAEFSQYLAAGQIKLVDGVTQSAVETALADQWVPKIGGGGNQGSDILSPALQAQITSVAEVQEEQLLSKQLAGQSGAVQQSELAVDLQSDQEALAAALAEDGAGSLAAVTDEGDLAAVEQLAGELA